jgi:predicted ATPase/DNA-binding winged helix-turn-helix (wHTH) protein
VTAATTPVSYRFGRFELQPEERQLFADGVPVRVGPHAFDLLDALLERAGQLVTKTQLLARVWPRAVIEDNTLQAHISALRKVLGANAILTVSGRGYRLVPEVARIDGSRTTDLPARKHNLPNRLTSFIGRDNVVETLVASLSERRLVSVVGIGGIGKTSVALRVAESIGPKFRDGTVLVELGPLVDPREVVRAVASSLGITTSSIDSIESIVSALRSSQILIVLDNCEHLADAAATMTERLLTGTAGVRILATSREPLNIDGEWIYRLEPLATPLPSPQLTLKQLFTYGAAELFVHRARAADDALQVGEEESALVAELCRRLDGLPLAIELAAASVKALGLKELVARVEERLSLFTRGRRTALPRHQTLRAVLDWSHDLLAPAERITLYRLATFRGRFSLESACAVATVGKLSPDEVVEHVLQLTDKSLLTAAEGEDGMRYRLLETTRAYALEKLVDAGEAQSAFSQHASHLLQLMQDAAAEWTRSEQEAWSRRHAHHIDDVQAALDWCFSVSGDAGIGVRLTAAALMLVYASGQLDGYHDRLDQALDRIEATSLTGTETELWLNVALVFPGGRGETAARPHAAACARSIELADQLGGPQHQLAALHSTWVQAFRDADYRPALAIVERMEAPAAALEPSGKLLCGRLNAQTLHFRGMHARAKAHAEEVLRHAHQPMPLGCISPVPAGVAMRIVLARVAWLQGFADRAAHLADECLDLSAHHPFALTQALAMAACPVALWRGDDDKARNLVDRLQRHSARIGSAYWQGWGAVFDRVIHVREQSLDAAKVAGGVVVRKVLDHGATFLDAPPDDSTLARAEAGAIDWCAAEILRLQAEARLNAGGAVVEVEKRLSDALELARAQGALAWELRCASSLARLWVRADRFADAHGLLSEVRSRFAEGFETRDLLQLSQDIEALAPRLIR